MDTETRQGAWRKQGQRPATNNVTQPAYNLGGPCVRGIKGQKSPGKKPMPPSGEVLATACAKQLESLNEIALKQIEGGSTNGLVVEYRQLPEVSMIDGWMDGWMVERTGNGGMFWLDTGVLLPDMAVALVRASLRSSRGCKKLVPVSASGPCAECPVCAGMHACMLLLCLCGGLITMPCVVAFRAGGGGRLCLLSSSCGNSMHSSPCCVPISIPNQGTANTRPRGSSSSL